MRYARFDWDAEKNRQNQLKHGVSFELAQQVFFDPRCVIAADAGHSSSEARLYCIDRVQDGILMVRFTVRRKVVRIIGAGYWRKGKRLYEKKNKVYR